MSAATHVLPCVGHAGLYDAVLFPEKGKPADPSARASAARLCAGCPAPCGQKVTADTVAPLLRLLDEDWLPPAKEGRAAPEPPTPTRRRQRTHLPPIGRDYVKPSHRPAAWARMARQLTDQGASAEQVAEQLCVSPDTARALIERGAA